MVSTLRQEFFDPSGSVIVRSRTVRHQTEEELWFQFGSKCERTRAVRRIKNYKIVFALARFSHHDE